MSSEYLYQDTKIRDIKVKQGSVPVVFGLASEQLMFIVVFTATRFQSLGPLDRSAQ